MKILSCGAGMQSTALALISCENKLAAIQGHPAPHPIVPIYDAVLFCNLGMEPPWVLAQVDFIQRACESAGIRFEVLDAPLYADFMKNFGERRTISIPWWTVSSDGHKSKMPRNCTIDYKVEVISKFVRWTLLGYRKGQRLRSEDHKSHEMHMGFSFEEQRRCKENPNPMFVNRFPLVDMGWTRADSYAYIKDVWGLETKASACTFCPFHKNYFFRHLKLHYPKDCQNVVDFDDMLERMQPHSPIRNEVYLSRSRKRIRNLEPEDCADAQTFSYWGLQIWNGF